MEPSSLPSYVTAGFTTIQTQFNAISETAWPIIMLSIGGFILIKLVKRFASKI
ncbi:Phage major coat protein, Gp8 [compost metagenome]